MTAAALSFLIMNFCSVGDVKDLDDYDKATCVDFMNNCSVAQSGMIGKKTVDKCQKLWLDKGRQVADFIKRSE